MGYELCETEEQWLAFRNDGIGGSDVGTVLGFNAFKSPYQLWLEKTHQVEPPDLSNKVQIQVGHELEDLVSKIFTQETGLKVQRDNKSYFKEDKPFLHANIDRKIIGQKALLECKTTGIYNKKLWLEDEVPASYLLQVQHYLNVLDFDKAYIAVIIGNSDFIWKEIERDEELIKLYEDKVTIFWQENVMKGIAPVIDGSNSTKQSINELYSEEYTQEVALDKLHIDTVRELININNTLKENKAYKQELENKLKAYLGENQANIGASNQYIASWKTQNRNRIDTQRLKTEHPDIYQEYSTPTTIKVLRVKENS